MRGWITVLGGVEILGGGALTVWPELPNWIGYLVMLIGVLTIAWGLREVAEDNGGRIIPRLGRSKSNANGLLPLTEFRDMAIKAGWPKKIDDHAWIEFKQKLREAALNGAVVVWGRLEVSSFDELVAAQPREPIAADFWREHDFDLWGLFGGGPNLDVGTDKKGQSGYGDEPRYRDLHVEEKSARKWLIHNKRK